MEIRVEKIKICVKWEGKWVSGLPNNTSTSTKLCGDLAAVLSWWEQRPSPISTYFVFCADHIKGETLKATSVCTQAAAEVLCVHPNSRGALGDLGHFFWLLLPCLSPPLSTLPSSLCPQTFWLWLFLWKKSNNTIWCPSPDSESLNTSYSFVGCSPGCLPSMVEGKSKWCIWHFRC